MGGTRGEDSEGGGGRAGEIVKGMWEGALEVMEGTR